MSSPVELAQFQSAAVRHIVSRLQDKRGSRRFLLADEVGLGKTIVARGVIDSLAARRRAGLTVLYLCSNAEIAEQNRRKLADGGGVSVGRVTELAWQKRATGPGVHLYAFTPGTSLSGGTGMAKERRLMLFLLGLLFGKPVERQKWREFFRCGVKRERWMADTRPTALDDEFLRKTHLTFQKKLSTAISESATLTGTLVARIAVAVDAYDDNDVARKRDRTRCISEFRQILQRVTLRSLDSDLILLDEVQRFKDVIDHAGDARRVSSELFRMNVPVLILSATPYRVLKLEHEVRDQGSDHHQDFFRTLDFLFGRDKAAPAAVRRDLTRLGDRLQEIELTGPRDDEIISLKRSVERSLKRVMCRTERTWYFNESRDTVREQLAGTELPTHEELCEFFDLHRSLAPYLNGVGLVTDFWKSSPSLLTFMDGSYKLVQRLKEQRVRVPKRLLTRAGDPTLPLRNLRMRMLIKQALGTPDKPPLLWTKPSYLYHRDESYGADSPRKVLAFSGWRFAPKAIAVVVSNVASTRLRLKRSERRQPLRFGEKWAFHVFDVCFPSRALAAIVNPRLGLDGRPSEERSAREVIASAVKALRPVLAAAKVTVSPVGSDPLWKAAMRLETHMGFAGEVRRALDGWKDADDLTGRQMLEHRNHLLEWLRDDVAQLRISERDLRHLALISVASPAVSLLRSLLTVFEAERVTETATELLNTCFGELRAYFNRPTVQQAVRTHRPRTANVRRRQRKRGFAESVLHYALDHHFLAVMDEHSFLLRHAADCPTVTSVLARYRSVWSLGRGAPRTNAPAGRGTRVQLGLDVEASSAHFALAFGDDGTKELQKEDSDGRLRRSDLREAFNSPFWPFVLATTSVGQEGLDFHLYCRDILHWNLPSNPVDLEQREGRINRRDCLAIRHSIAADWPLASIADGMTSPNANPWYLLFERLKSESSTQHHRHGLYPHWIYECKDPTQTVHVTRHAALYSASRDTQRYSALTKGLALYRLAFGQANQEHLLANLEQKLAGLDAKQRSYAQRRLSGYMLNLSPVSRGDVLRSAREEAGVLMNDQGGEGIRQLVADVEQKMAEYSDELTPARDALDALLKVVRTVVAVPPRRRRIALTALAYLRNAYDEFFDGRVAGGFDDDVAVLVKAAKGIALVK